MNSAIEQIKKECKSLKGRVLHSISYTSDERNNAENIEWANQLFEEDKNFSQYIEFESILRSSSHDEQQIWIWSWSFARTDGGDWILLTHGYG
jgi:viroplasmin and RNaseH domain-containing protein